MHKPSNNFSAAKAFKGLLLLIFTFFFTHTTALAAPDGKALFNSNCASCHNPLKDATGPALQGVSARVPNKEWIYKWVHNSASQVASGDKYANDLYTKWNKVNMTAFPGLATDEIDAIVKYVEEYKAPVAAAPTAGANGAGNDGGENNNFLYFLITAILAIVALVLVQVNKKLNVISAKEVGYAVKKEVPWYRHKLYIALAAILLIVGFGIYLTKSWGTQLGRQEGYKPTQPIFYSHKVHAGINQINCQYCHSGAEKSKHAMVPSTNVCMNCHKGINEYTGAETHPLVDDNGKKIDGTAEIKKLYEYAGWDASKKQYIRDAAGNIKATPIPWIKIHNMPDHVAFNHNTHVKAGKVACQRCHGGIQEMDEVYQATSLSMGFCINCHRETKVQFTENNYYKIFQKYHDEIKAGTRDSVTVKDIGGLECQKCHY